MEAPEKLQQQVIGNVNDLRAFLNTLPSEVDGLEMLYQVTAWKDHKSNESWLEITEHE